MNLSLFEAAFAHARLKINRANRHIDEAEQWFGAYAKSDFYDLVDDRDSQTGKQFIRFKAQPIPGDLALAIGDAFHCLSSSLDYVMSGLMRAKTGDAMRVSFPTDETRESLRKSFMPPRPGKKAPPRRRIVEAFPALVFELFTSIKPYEGGNFALWEVRKADNIDKHNLIIPSLTVAQISDVMLVDEVNNVRLGGTLAVGAGGVLNAIGYRNGDQVLKLENKGQATVSIAFPDAAEVFAGKPVLPTLRECSQLVLEATEIIERATKRHCLPQN